MAYRPSRHVVVVLFVLIFALIGSIFLWIDQNHDEQQHGFFRRFRAPNHGSNNNKSNRPLHVVYHIGPAKMGSTSIQIGALQNFEHELQADGYNIYDFRHASKLNQCLAKNVAKCQSQPDQEWSHFVKFIKISKQQSRHVVISTENYWNHLSNDTSTLLSVYHDIFDTLEYHVRIVIGYRPLFEYWPSVYFQEYDHFCGYSHSDARIIPSLVKFLERANDTKQLRHPSLAALQHAQHYFDDVFILPLGDKFVERFLCNALVGASHACAAASSKQDEKDNATIAMNQRHSLAFDRLAQAARTHGLSHTPCKTLSRHFQETLMNQNITQLPRTCLEESQQEWLWNKTLFYHTALVPNDTLSDTDDLRLEFEQVSSTTLCDVDVEQVLAAYPNLVGAKEKEPQNQRPPA